jgi:hypothetical protein
LVTHLNLIPTLKMRGAILSVPYTIRFYTKKKKIVSSILKKTPILDIVIFVFISESSAQSPQIWQTLL